MVNPFLDTPARHPVTTSAEVPIASVDPIGAPQAERVTVDEVHHNTVHEIPIEGFPRTETHEELPPLNTHDQPCRGRKIYPL